ncbi:MAG TPA: hypothetical protein VFZ83_02365 [Acidimicrobiia bacterium]|nr:hypothetical protein [Acidimicrobiia bacterium]
MTAGVVTTGERSRPVRAALLAGAILLLALAAWLGAHEFSGTFGVTGQPVSCGSVWGLTRTDNLNAMSCTDELRTRVTVVAVLVGVAGLLASVPWVITSGRAWSTARRWLFAVALGVPIALAVAIVVVGRHRIWSVSGA